ncbi:MAG: histidine phosphatase family protein [Acidimicrobiales bacterium]
MQKPQTEGMPEDLVLVRHGHSEGNRALDAAKGGDTSLMTPEFRRRSTAEWRLTNKGRTQAAAAGDWLKNNGLEHFDRYYCSTFARTRETAALLGLAEARWQLEPLVRERDWGLWEGRSRDLTTEMFPISSEQKRRNAFLWRPECGESIPDLDLRAREMFATFARELAGGRVICITHEDVMWAMRFRLEKMKVKEWIDHDDKIPNCGILHYTRRAADGTVGPKFERVRLVDPTDPETFEAWQPIQRPRFSNEELIADVRKIEPLWTDSAS